MGSDLPYSQSYSKNSRGKRNGISIFISSQNNNLFLQHFSRGSKSVNVMTGAETSVKKMKTQLWDSVVNIVLVEAKDIVFKDDNNSSDIHIRFKLGSEKYKSRVFLITYRKLSFTKIN